MVEGLPKFFDPRGLALRNAILQGSIGSDELPRVSADYLIPIRFQVEVTGYLVDSKWPCLDVQVTGVVRQMCQRCLEPVDHPVDLLDRFVVDVKGDGELDGPAGYDSLSLAGDPGSVSVAELVEDALILGVPGRPCHLPGLCNLAGLGFSSPGDTGPFAALQQLRAPHVAIDADAGESPNKTHLDRE